MVDMENTMKMNPKYQQLDALHSLIYDYNCSYYEELKIDDVNGMADLYADDLKEATKALMMFRAGQFTKLAAHIERMDTMPREAVVVAFAQDMGSKWVADTLGYEVRV
jgi:hypothetical protein